MEISVVVAAGKLSEDLYRLLRSLEEQILKPREIVIVAPRGCGEAVNLIDGVGIEVRVIELPRDPGPIRARILGALSARSPLVAFIDSDCMAPPDWLSSMLSEMLSYSVDVVAGSVEGINVESFISRLQERSLISPNPKFGYAKLLRGDLGLNLVVTANMLVKREILFEEAVIPPSYGKFGFEDLDFIHRILKRGYVVLCSPVRVYHFNRVELASVIRRYYEYGRGLPYFRRSSANSLYSLVITVLLYSLLAVLAAGLTALAIGKLLEGILALSLLLLPFYSHHLPRLNDGGLERFIYPPLELLLAISSALGALRSELALYRAGT